LPATKERREDVAKVGEPATAEATTVAATVVVVTRRRVTQDLVGVRHQFEALLGILIRVHVRVELPRQPTIGLLDVVARGVTRNAQYFVVICHRDSFLCC
jgi:hypothetical protein